VDKSVDPMYVSNHSRTRHGELWTDVSFFISLQQGDRMVWCALATPDFRWNSETGMHNWIADIQPEFMDHNGVRATKGSPLPHPRFPPGDSEFTLEPNAELCMRLFAIDTRSARVLPMMCGQPDRSGTMMSFGLELDSRKILMDSAITHPPISPTLHHDPDNHSHSVQMKLEVDMKLFCVVPGPVGTPMEARVLSCSLADSGGGGHCCNVLGCEFSEKVDTAAPVVEILTGPMDAPRFTVDAARARARAYIMDNRSAQWM
jgi:hypothetical protein